MNEIEKKQFLREHLATNANSIPLGIRGYQASYTKSDEVIEITETSTVHQKVRDKENQPHMDMSDQSAQLQATMEES